MAYLNRLLMLCAICVLALPTLASAQEVKIAVVDVEKILSESQAGKSLQSQLNTRRESFQKEFATREDTLMASQKNLMQQKGNLTAEEFSTKRTAFEKELFETRSLFQKRRNSLDKGLGTALSQLRQNIIQVTAEVANEAKYQIVLTRDSVVIIEKEMDITDSVLLRLNAKVSNIPLTIN